jgi:hypothetical protein
LIKSSQILEEYHSLYKDRYVSVPIFLNPNRFDFKEIGDNVRFIADARTKKLYAWDASVIIHCKVAEFLGLEKISSPAVFWGYAVSHNNRYVVVSSDELSSRVNIYDLKVSHRFIDDFFDQDWSWVNKYIDTSAYFDFVKNFISNKNIGYFRMPDEIPL